MPSTAIENIMRDIKTLGDMGYQSPYYNEIFIAYFEKHMFPYFNSDQKQQTILTIKDVVKNHNIVKLLDLPTDINMPSNIELGVNWRMIIHLTNFICQSLQPEHQSIKFDYNSAFSKYIGQFIFNYNNQNHSFNSQVNLTIEEIVDTYDITTLMRLPSIFNAIQSEYTLEWQMIIHMINFVCDIYLIN